MPKSHQIPLQFDRSTKPLSTESTETSVDLKPGTKRLFRNIYNSEDFQHIDGQQELHPRRNVSQSYGDENEDECDDNIEHSGKRYRTSDWPLKSRVEKQNVFNKAPLGNRSRGNGSSASSANMSAPPRPSKFVEGSMNDRVSQKPHSTYIGVDEDGRNQYQTRHTRTRDIQMSGLTHHANRSVGFGSLPDKSDTTRHSGIFRFGKSLSAAFNPSNWKMWSHKQQDNEDDIQEQVFRERRENAAFIYQNMKQKGLFQDSSDAVTFNPKSSGLALNKHDSGVEIGQRISFDGATTRVRPSSKTPMPEKRYGRVFLEAPNTCAVGHSESPVSEEHSSPQKPSLHFKKPSLSNLKFMPGSAQKSGSTDDSTYDPQRLKKLPSHKDLQKQQKLVKRVSDLEGKLEAARRQLSEALGEPVPELPLYSSRSRFKPGNLATLPSERLLSDCLGPPENFTKPNFAIGMAVSTDNYSQEAEDQEEEVQQPVVSRGLEEIDVPSHLSILQKQTSEVVPSIEMESNQALKSKHDEVSKPGWTVKEDGRNTADPVAAAPETQKSKKRKSTDFGYADDGGEYKPLASHSDSEDDEVNSKKMSPKQNALRTRKLRKVDSESDLVGTSAGRPEAGGWSRVEVVSRLHSPRGRTVVSRKIPPSINNGIKAPGRGRQVITHHPDSLVSSKASTRTINPDMKTFHAEEDDDEKSFHATPPVPKVPNIVRLASGEVVKIPSTAVLPINNKAGIQSPEIIKDDKPMAVELLMHEEKKHSTRNELFEWPEDVF